ncbi:hypothetical protein GW915_08535 [bacterium]|nr:hypothetical protein [bacterium]
MILKLFDPTLWDIRHYLVVVIGLCALNLFGPRGFVHLFYLQKETQRIATQKEAVSQTIAQLEIETKSFKQSKTVRARAIREQLGYLASDELSIELPIKITNTSKEKTRILR